jgi:hypothetical protein
LGSGRGLTEVGRREKPPSVEWNVLRADLLPKACARALASRTVNLSAVLPSLRSGCEVIVWDAGRESHICQRMADVGHRASGMERWCPSARDHSDAEETLTVGLPSRSSTRNVPCISGNAEPMYNRIASGPRMPVPPIITDVSKAPPTIAPMRLIPSA